MQDRHFDEQQRHRAPVERHDARQSPPRENLVAAGRGEESVRRIDHDETGNDEEEIDAGAPGQQEARAEYLGPWRSMGMAMKACA
jgi:hypothetical protein